MEHKMSQITRTEVLAKKRNFTWLVATRPFDMSLKPP